MEIQNYIERIVRLTEEKHEVQQDIKDLYKQAKGEGYDKKAIQRVVKLLSMDKVSRDEYLFLVQKYLDKVENPVTPTVEQ